MKKKIYRMMNFIMLVAGVIWSFTNVGYDEGYQIAMAYRLTTGDGLLTQMLEPHQLSAFLCGGLIALYKAAFGTYTGVVLYLQVVGVLLRAACSVGLYVFLKKESDWKIAYGAAVLFFMITPKDFAMPEFGNQQVWLGMALFVFLFLAVVRKQLRYVVLAAISLCLQVLSYPSCIIEYVAGMVLLFLYAPKDFRKKAAMVFAGVCAAIGGGVLSFFLVQLGVDGLMDSLALMVSIEPSHTTSALERVLTYIKDFAALLPIYGAVAVISIAIEAVLLFMKKKSGNVDKSYKLALFWVISGVVFLCGFAANILLMKDRCAYSILFFYMIGVGIYYAKHLTDRIRMLYIMGTVIGCTGFVATLLLTDLPLTVSGAYAILAIALSLIPLGTVVENREERTIRRMAYGLFFGLFALLFFRCVYIRTPISGRGQICTIFNTDMSYVHDGPAKWIVTNNDGAMEQQQSYAEFKEYVPEGSNIWIANTLVDGLGYLYVDSEVAVPSVISDPKYEYEEYFETLRQYWEKYPDKYPDVVIVASYEGNLRFEMQNNPLFMNWLEEEYQPSRYVDGVYWRYYYK